MSVQPIPNPAPGPNPQTRNPQCNWVYGPGKAVVVRRGVNAKGNRWAKMMGSNGATGYRYHNLDGSWAYVNPDGSKYYENAEGVSRLTWPDGRITWEVKSARKIPGVQELASGAQVPLVPCPLTTVGDGKEAGPSGSGSGSGSRGVIAERENEMEEKEVEKGEKNSSVNDASADA